MAKIASVKDFARKVGQGFDDTAAFTAAFAAQQGGKLLVPAGTYLVTGAIPAANSGSIELVGDGHGCTHISTNQATGDVFTFGSNYTRVSGIHFTSSVTRTAGSFIQFNSSRSEMDWCRFDQYFKGIDLGMAASFDADHCIFLGSTFAGADSAINLSANGADVALQHIVMDGPSGTMPVCGIRVIQTADLTMEDVSIIHHGKDLLLAPGNSQVIASLYATDCHFDTATNGIAMLPTGSGAIVRSRFVGCWMSSHTGQGVVITGGGSTVINGLEFEDPHIFLNGAAGFDVTAVGPINIEIMGGEIAQNTGAGVRMNGNSEWAVIGSRIGNVAGFSGNSTYGINIGASTCDNFRIIGCDLRGNTTNAYANSSTGTNFVILGNIPRILGTGWAAWTGTPTRTTKVTSTATLANVAEAVKALIDDLIAQGVIGA